MVRGNIEHKCYTVDDTAICLIYENVVHPYGNRRPASAARYLELAGIPAGRGRGPIRGPTVFAYRGDGTAVFGIEYYGPHILAAVGEPKMVIEVAQWLRKHRQEEGISYDMWLQLVATACDTYKRLGLECTMVEKKYIGKNRVKRYCMCRLP